jgi:hypothetical protein
MNCKDNQKIKNFGLRRGLSVLGAAAALCCAPAYAATINFESLDPSANMSGETLTESGYNLLLVNGPVAAEFGFESGVGAVLDSADPFSCDITGCPSGATGKYLAILNDGAVTLTSNGSSHWFQLSGMDFAFVSPAPVLDGDYGRIVLAGVNLAGDTVETMLAFPGQDAQGRFTFGASSLSAAFRSTVFTSLTISACLWDADGNCSNSFESPAFNQAQFALDNISVSDVPEPASFLLAGIGIAALGLSRRRASKPAALSTTI